MLFIFDIDETIAELTALQRSLLKEAEKPLVLMDWISFYADIPKQKPISYMKPILRFIDATNLPLVFSTSRSSKYGKPTAQWILYHFGLTNNGFKLCMRGAEDRRPSHQVKKDNLKQLKEDFKITDMKKIFVTDDDQLCMDMYLKEGCNYVHPLYFPDLPTRLP